jgi:hypothetical protein
MGRLKSFITNAANLASSITDKAESIAEKIKSSLQKNKVQLLNSKYKYGKQVSSVAGGFLYE